MFVKMEEDNGKVARRKKRYWREINLRDNRKRMKT
jgi:hypothetical protein